jgi:ABC-type sugar transport system ATPase subunit
MVFLSLKNISKTYPGVKALDRVNLDMVKGEIHALVGENGAGKSTLMKILVGAETKDEGEIILEGNRVEIPSPMKAQELGISMIFQEFNLIPYLSVAENIFLGRPPVKGFFKLIDWKTARTRAKSLIKELGIELDVTTTIENLSVAQQQMVEIAKALSLQSRILIMDEPSATLSQFELQNLFMLIRRLKGQGINIIYISHRIEEIFGIADRVTVLRDGRGIGTHMICQINRQILIKEMVGRELTEEYPWQPREKGPAILTVRNLTLAKKLHNISFTLCRNEILGITGLVGAGKTEVARAIFGDLPFDKGDIIFEGKKISVLSPAEAIRLGIGLLPEDRKRQGLVLGMKVRENISLADLNRLTRLGIISKRQERFEAKKYIVDLKIKTPSTDQFIKNLSGGTQQKVVLAKWLFTQCRLLILDEPTRGIDIGGKVEIYHAINTLVGKGIGIIIISSELPEILGMCDKILVLNQGRLATELSRGEATQEKIMYYAAGGI